MTQLNVALQLDMVVVSNERGRFKTKIFRHRFIVENDKFPQVNNPLVVSLTCGPVPELF